MRIEHNKQAVITMSFHDSWANKFFFIPIAYSIFFLHPRPLYSSLFFYMKEEIELECPANISGPWFQPST